MVVSIAFPSPVQANPDVKYVLHLPASELPESIAIDPRGSMYLSLASAAKVIKISRGGERSTVATFAAGSTPLGVRLDASGNLYVAVVAGATLADSGVWRVPAGGGNPVEVAAIPGFLNGLAFDRRGNLYVSESAGGVIYRVNGRGSVGAWSASHLLAAITGSGPCGQPHPASPPLGANGLAFNRSGDLLVANTTAGTVVRIPVDKDGGPGRARLLAGPECRLWGADGVAMDNRDNLYVAANAERDIVRVSPHGSLHVLASFADGDPLYTPSDIAFGTGRGTRDHIFITDAAFFTGGAGAGVVTTDVGIPGRPLP
jgi:sugar lactone lactonase YvrE